MASSVLQLNLQKCSMLYARSARSVIHCQFVNETADFSATVINKTTNLCQSRSLSYLTPNSSISKQTNLYKKFYYVDIRHGLLQNIYRKYSTDEENRRSNKRQLPALMEFPRYVWPSLLKTIKNWILVNFIIRPYFDRDFEMPNFVNGTKHALQVVSSSLASSEFQSLDGLVSADALDELKRNLSVMSVSQRNEIAVIKDDIYFSFPYQVGVIFDESNEKPQKRYVEITMVFHVLRGLKQMQDAGTPPPLNVGMLPEYQSKISICNYRFIKQFTQGIESDWTINIATHFKPVDVIAE